MRDAETVGVVEGVLDADFFAGARRTGWSDTRGFRPVRRLSGSSVGGFDTFRGRCPSPEWARRGAGSLRKLGSVEALWREDARAASLAVLSGEEGAL